MKIKQINKLIATTAGAMLCLLIEGNAVAYDRPVFDSNRDIDLVGNGGEFGFLFTPAVADNQFKGSILSGRAFLYQGGTLDASDCTPFVACGVVQSTVPGEFVPEFPDKVIGHVTLQIRMLSDEFDDALTAFLANDIDTYLAKLPALSGRIINEFTGILNFNNSLDYLVPGRDTLTIHGYIVGGLQGERFSLAVTGGTGKYKNAKGVVQFQRLTAVNGSGVNSFRVRLPRFKYQSLRNFSGHD